MFSLSRSLGKVYFNYNHFTKLFCIKTNIIDNVLDFKSSFSDQQNYKILEILNESSPEELSKYNIPLARIQNLTNWKSKKGCFKNLNEVLEVEGFGKSILKEIGDSISHNNDAENVQTSKSKPNQRIKHLVVPNINFNILSRLNSAVAIHLEPTGISWARLDQHNNLLTGWTCENFSSLPQKMMPTDTFNLVLKLLRKTPPGDVYIFETVNGLGPQAQGKQVSVSTHNQKMELISMLLALINTSVSHNPSLQTLDAEERTIVNRAFFLKSNIPARLFGTLIGSEKVSAVTAINGLLKHEIDFRDSLPYTPVIFEENLKRAFFNQSSTNKELLAQALMLAVSFMDLYVRRKSISYEALNLNKSRRKKSS